MKTVDCVGGTPSRTGRAVRQTPLPQPWRARDCADRPDPPIL